MEDIIRKFNPWWDKKFETNSIIRESYVDFIEQSYNRKDIEFITGLRRIGKTTIMKQIIEFLIKKKKIHPQKICYLSLDNYSFLNKSIYELVKTFQKINQLKIDEQIYIFLDEITFKENFSQELKNLYDFGHIKIYVSSSSASLLKDKHAFLTGRARTTEIEPLNFKEFLKFSDLEFSKREKPLMQSYFEKYMEIGGIPEYVLTKDPAYITNMVDSIIEKDIIAKFRVKKPMLIKELFRLLCERSGKALTYSKLSKISNLSRDAVKEYISYFEQTYLFTLIEKKGKLNERILGEKKLYVADIGIKNIIVGFKDKGSLFENLVFNKIKRKKPNFILTKDGEIDFCFEDTLIEVKYGKEMNEKQQKLFNSLKYKNKVLIKDISFFFY